MTWSEVLKSLAFWGPGALIATLMIVALYKLADKYLGEFVKAQQSQAEALGKLAQGADNLRGCIDTLMTRDNSEHREMMILLKCIMQKTERVEEHIYGS